MDNMNETVTVFITEIITSMTKSMLSFLKQKANNWKDKYFNKGIKDYLNSMYDKFSNVKTFLHRNQPENFYKRYFNVLLNDSKENKILSVSKIDDFFKDNNFVSIISPAGSGKTMFMKNIFLKTLEQKIKKIPIVIELRDINLEEDFIKKYILKKIKMDNEDILNEFLNNGNFLFLFDGYDEISQKNKKDISNQMENFIDNFNKNYFLITSRPGAGLENIPRFKSFGIKDLNISQIEEFIKIQIDDDSSRNKIITVIKDNFTNNTIFEYLKNPLLLSMFIFTFESYPEIPKSMSKFYWNVYDTLCNKHDSITKFGCYHHERKSNLKDEDITKFLEWFAFKSFFENKYSFSEEYLKEKLIKIQEKLKLKTDIESLVYDFTVSISILIKDGLYYKFPHKTLQEYFVVRLINDFNEEKKEKIYSKCIKLLPIIPNISFFNLCKEMDAFYFKKYFILIILYKFLSEIDFSNDINKIISFLKTTKLKHCFYYEDDYTICLFRYQYCSQIFDIIDFLTNKFDYVFPNNIIKINDNLKILFTEYDDTKDNLRICNESKKVIIDYIATKNNKNLYEFLQISGLKDNILNFIKTVENEKIKIEKEIREQEKNIQDLIDESIL